MKAKEVKELLGITQVTLSKYVKNGLIKVIKINPWHYVYDAMDVYAMIGRKKNNKIKNISYSRVSTNKQKYDLKTQTERIHNWSIMNGIILDEQYEEIGSGINYKKN